MFTLLCDCPWGVTAVVGYLQRVLRRGALEPAVLPSSDAGAPAVNRDDQDTVLLAAVLERLVDAEGRRLIDGVDDVDAGILGQAVLHRRLALRLIATTVGDADDLRVAVADAVAQEEAVVAELAGRAPRRLVEHGDLDAGLARRGSLGVLADQLARLLVVRWEHTVAGIDPA